MEQRKRFYIALAIYAVLGLLIWMTIDNIPLLGDLNHPASLQNPHVTLRGVTLGVLALFVLRTVLHWRAEEIRSAREDEQEDVSS